ncbi:hypothetical protein HETIRDRAFT_162768 [Heterobasidion irregulare TC 32-1]|uniref:Uncharacterized protein n=1 Tax=Heterobasidion irregulare (strain TC 32-1) TaxID=747525 RepID=W4JR01_HETIT|nr:uncharacterized protein HETIRDRAFT_162768 [Heterobasidion irregulare TC 32-1]ETW75997.1 hypothetical protein HETIRDRAFT_162768 [Heterobasidion irregulare TC 32-1]
MALPSYMLLLVPCINLDIIHDHYEILLTYLKQIKKGIYYASQLPTLYVA